MPPRTQDLSYAGHAGVLRFGGTGARFRGTDSAARGAPIRRHGLRREFPRVRDSAARGRFILECALRRHGVLRFGGTGPVFNLLHTSNYLIYLLMESKLVLPSEGSARCVPTKPPERVVPSCRDRWNKTNINKSIKQHGENHRYTGGKARRGQQRVLGS